VFQQSKIDAVILARSSFGNRSVRRVRASQLRFLIYNSGETMREGSVRVWEGREEDYRASISTCRSWCNGMRHTSSHSLRPPSCERERERERRDPDDTRRGKLGGEEEGTRHNNALEEGEICGGLNYAARAPSCADLHFAARSARGGEIRETLVQNLLDDLLGSAAQATIGPCVLSSE